MNSHLGARRTGGSLRPMAGAAAQAPRESPLLRIFSEDRHHLTFTWGPLLGTLWRRETFVSAVEELKAVLPSLAATLPGKKAGVLTIVAADASLPSSDARNALLHVFRECAESVVCS